MSLGAQLPDQRRRRSPRTRRSGAVAVEFALIFPLLIATLLAFVGIIFVMHDYAVLTNAAREGVRYAVVYRKPYRPWSDIRGVATNYAAANLFGNYSGITVETVSDYAFCTTTACSCARSGDRLTVRVKVTISSSSVMYAFYRVVLPSFPMQASATMRCE